MEKEKVSKTLDEESPCNRSEHQDKENTLKAKSQKRSPDFFFPEISQEMHTTKEINKEINQERG